MKMFDKEAWGLRIEEIQRGNIGLKYSVTVWLRISLLIIDIQWDDIGLNILGKEISDWETGETADW